MTERYCEGERFTGLSFAGEVFESCDFADCVFVDCSFTKCELDHTTLNECKFMRCEITGLRSTHSSVQSLDFEDCRLNEIEWAPLMSNGAFPDPIHTLKECSLKYNTFTEMNFNRFDFSDGNEIVGSMFAKCEMQLANFKGVEPIEKDGEITGYRAEIMLEKATYEEWFDGSFTKTICGAKNRNQLLKAKTIAEELGLVENKDFFLIRDACHTELEPEEFDENGEGMTLTCIGFRPLPDEIAHQISHKFHLY